MSVLSTRSRTDGLPTVLSPSCARPLRYSGSSLVGRCPGHLLSQALGWDTTRCRLQVARVRVSTARRRLGASDVARTWVCVRHLAGSPLGCACRQAGARVVVVVLWWKSCRQITRVVVTGATWSRERQYVRDINTVNNAEFYSCGKLKFLQPVCNWKTWLCAWKLFTAVSKESQSNIPVTI